MVKANGLLLIILYFIYKIYSYHNDHITEIHRYIMKTNTNYKNSTNKNI